MSRKSKEFIVTVMISIAIAIGLIIKHKFSVLCHYYSARRQIS